MNNAAKDSNRDVLKPIARELLDTISQGVILADLDGNIRRINQAALKLLNLSDAESKRVTISLLFPDIDFSLDFRDREISILRRDKQLHLYLSQSSLNKRGFELGKLITFSDITSRKEAEKYLELSENALRDKASQEHSRTEQAIKMEALGTMAGGIAHDFNNLLSAIVGFTSAAREDLPPEHHIQRDLEEVTVASARTSDMVRQILAFSRREEYDFEVKDIRRVIEKSLGLLQTLLPSTIQIRVDLGNQPVWVSAAESQLNQVVMNLGTNAMRALEETGGELFVGLDITPIDPLLAERNASLKPGPVARITVSDNGCGISTLSLPRIFDPFYNDWRGGIVSTGLGLSTAFGIVKSHRGSIHVESELGFQTTFYIYLPLAETPTDP